MNLPNDINVSECTNAFIWKGVDDIVYIKNKPGIYIELETHKEAFETIKQVCDGQCCGLVVDLVGIHGITKASRDYSGSKEHLDYVSGAALLISNPVTKILGNFFMGLNKPNFPTQLFTDIDQAEKWLKTIPKVNV
ncbi:MAG: hypothetical protein JKY09_03890 [Crocinitomicaceae bacterium]|nr:hypothetical protein [Crocinitomicaceae bacterium]